VPVNWGGASSVGIGFRAIARFTRPANVTPYTVGATVGAAGTAGAVHRLAGIGPVGGHYKIQSLDISMTGSTLPSGMAGGFRVHFYTAEPLPAADNAAFAADTTERLIHIGYIDTSTLELFGSGFLRATNSTERIRFQSITDDLWVKVVTLTGNGFTPVSGAQFEIDVRGTSIGAPSTTVNSLPWLIDSIYRKAEQLPSVSWRFAEDRNLTDRISGLTLDFTRTTPRTWEQADKTSGTVGINEPAFSYLNGVSQGLDVWTSRTNLFLNSDAPTAQDITVTAAVHTLSFRGTGTVTLSDASTAGPLNGTGANNQVQLGFTPSAGTLTVTPSGDVRELQVELGVGASPYIPTAEKPATRTADIATTRNLSWFNPSGGVFYVEWAFAAQNSSNRAQFSIDDGTNNNRVQSFISGSTANFRVTRSAAATGPGVVSIGAAVSGKIALSFAAGAASGAASNGTLATAGGTLAGPLDMLTILRIGRDAGGFPQNGPIARLDYYEPDAAQSFLQRMTP